MEKFKEIFLTKNNKSTNNLPKGIIDTIKFIKKHGSQIIFTIILLIAIFTRLYKIDEIPRGLNVDEAGIAYDAFCMANYGTDRFLNKMPVYMINFGVGQSALYTYIDSIFIKVLGLNTIAIRLPSALLEITAIVLCYFMVKKELGENFALTFMAIITICPWHIMVSRWGLDCNLMAPMMVISLYLLLRAKSIWGYILAGISFGLTLYTYALSYIILPIFLALTIIFMLYTKRIKFRNVLIMGIPIFILALPLMLMLLVNNEIIDEVHSFITIPKLGNFRDSEIDFSYIEKNKEFFDKLVTHDSLVYNALPEFGTIYKFSIFLAVFGIFIEINDLVKNIKQRKFEIGSLMLFLYIAVMGCMLIIKGPNINKANAAFIPILFFTCKTIKMIYKNYKVFFWIIVVLYAVKFMEFQDFYFNKYSIEYKNQIYFEQELIDALDYIDEVPEFENKKLYINTTSQQPYIYTLIHNQTSPYDFNRSRYKEAGYKMSYGKYYFNTEEIEDDAVYLIKEKDAFLNKLKENGFITENLEGYVIAYK